MDYFWRPRVVALRYLEVLCWCRTWYCTCHVPFVQDRDTIIPSVLHEFLLYVGGAAALPCPVLSTAQRENRCCPLCSTHYFPLRLLPTLVSGPPGPQSRSDRKVDSSP